MGSTDITDLITAISRLPEPAWATVIGQGPLRVEDRTDLNGREASPFLNALFHFQLELGDAEPFIAAHKAKELAEYRRFDPSSRAADERVTCPPASVDSQFGFLVAAVHKPVFPDA